MDATILPPGTHANPSDKDSVVVGFVMLDNEVIFLLPSASDSYYREFCANFIKYSGFNRGFGPISWYSYNEMLDAAISDMIERDIFEELEN